MYSNQLRKYRESKNLLQKDMAKILNISEISYTHYESEYYIMPIKYLDILTNHFNISLNYLFEFQKNNTLNTIGLLNKEKSSNRLKEFRKENKLTQIKLAAFLNVSQSTIAEYEKGTNIIATPFLYMICKKYKISADYLLGKNDNPKYL